MEEKKTDDRYLLQKAIDRDSYQVFQANDMAKSFGKLKTFEHRMLDYCTSFITLDSKKTDIFTFTTAEVMKYFGLPDKGDSYNLIQETLNTLKNKTNLYLPIYKKDTETDEYILDKYNRKIKIGNVYTSTLSSIYYYDEGLIGIDFSPNIFPFLFELKRDFYTLSMRELSMVKGKYAMILVKLWQAQARNNPVVELTGTLDEWQTWFLGKEKRLATNIFKRDVLSKASEELERLFDLRIELDIKKRGRRITGYTMTITDIRMQIKMENSHEETNN
ncbi:MAG: replication initiation protein [Streptococcus parauberis]